MRAGPPVFLAVLLLFSSCVVSCGPVPGNELLALNRKMERLCQEGRYAEALPVGRQALEFAENNRGPDHPDTATILNNLGALYYSMGDYSKAESHYRRALKIREIKLAPDHPDTANTLNNLAVVYVEKGNYSEARLLYEHALRILESKYGTDHPNTAAGYNNLAGLYHNIGH